MKHVLINRLSDVFKKGNIKLFSFFLIAAFLFLFISKFSESYTQDVNLKVKITNLDDEIIILNDSLITANITLRAKGFDLIKYLFKSSSYIEIDGRTDVSKKDNSFYWDIINNRYKLVETLGSTVEVLSVNPDTIWFKYDVLDSKMVPIALNSNLTFESGFDVYGQLKLSQDSVKIIGSRQMIDTIKQIATAPIELLDINNDIDHNVDLLSSPNFEIIPNRVKLSANIKRFTEGKVSIPIKLVNLPANRKINYFPKSVDVLYYVDLENFEKVVAKDFTAVCDFNDLQNSSNQYIDIELRSMSPLVKNANIIQKRIEYIISN
ncbi:MAG: hypothetical protein ED556_14130 [Winogradskyella sp.]|uniref:CdaR family protein n=1 Tax=Winogradskyella sp. TaxID=1883156 RepID=UPI000F415FFA|nr:hypothetical protein [Winogradskyella sp.]RNC79802.1 MAG: hypothetical protein ED556_14130 [Winogradskyella sp.]